jgi:hypothetical protein
MCRILLQTPWVQNLSLKENITFGLPFDEAKYKQASVCMARSCVRVYVCVWHAWVWHVCVWSRHVCACFELCQRESGASPAAPSAHPTRTPATTARTRTYTPPPFHVCMHVYDTRVRVCLCGAQVIHACALELDLTILPKGDQVSRPPRVCVCMCV